MSGSAVSVESSSSLRALGVESVSVESSGAVSVSAGGCARGRVGRRVVVRVGRSSVGERWRRVCRRCSARARSLTASAVRVSSSSVLEASTVGSVSVSGSEGVSVSSGGSLVRLSPEGEGEFVGFVWESARSFDTFENTVSPSVSGVEELVIVSGTGSVRAWRERGVDRPVRWGGVGDGVERVAGRGGVLLAGGSERALRVAVGERRACAQRAWA